jgi:hypothetical protein
MSDRALSQLLADQYHQSMVAARRRGPVWSVTDMGELAVRLGSIVRFDRRGDVVFMDSFEDGLLKWGASWVAEGGSVALSHEAARSGGWSVLLTATPGHYTSMGLVLPYPVLGRFGLECSFQFDYFLDTLRLSLSLFNGTYLKTGRVRYDLPGERLQYCDADGNYQDLVTGLDLFSALMPFWTWKLVCDFEENEYVRLIVNEREYDLSGLALLSDDSSDVPHLEISVTNQAQMGGENSLVYVDDVVVTQNEPEN